MNQVIFFKDEREGRFRIKLLQTGLKKHIDIFNGSESISDIINLYDSIIYSYHVLLFINRNGYYVDELFTSEILNLPNRNNQKISSIIEDNLEKRTDPNAVIDLIRQGIMALKNSENFECIYEKLQETRKILIESL